MPQDQRYGRQSSRYEQDDERDRDYARGREEWRDDSRRFRSNRDEDERGESMYGRDRQDRHYQGTLRAGDYGRHEEQDHPSRQDFPRSERRFEREDRERDYGGGYGAREYGPDVNVGRSRRFGGSGGGYGYYGSASAGSAGNYGQGDRYGGGFGTYTRDYERKYGSGSEYSRRGERDYGGERGWWDRATDEVSSWFGDEDAERRRRIDHHRGRGPKNYTRSDDRIREDVSDRLTDDPLIDASDIEVSVSNQEVTLSGTVASRNERRLAEEVAEQVSGVKYVQNNLRVKVPISQSGVSGTSGTFGSGSSTTSR
jgi:osmotically-inducible protein OsmY